MIKRFCAGGLTQRLSRASIDSLVLMVLSVSLASSCLAEVSAQGEELTRLSLQDLANVEVTSVSKSAEGLQKAAATIYVVTHEDIELSGATSLMEALRLAPNLLIVQTSSTNYTISARGFGGNPQAQNFANKLLMLIDGRSVYTPLFSGIYSDAQDVLLEDVDRIEVISGPGATLWGANAMNGVVNVITRPSYLTQGSLIDVAGGNQEKDVNLRYGGRTDGELSYRIYGQGFERASEQLPSGDLAHDSWYKGQGGFRADWSTDRNAATLQGDLYRAVERQFAGGDLVIAGGNIVSRYQHHSEHADLEIQAYFDQSQRFAPPGGDAFVLHTYDLQLQQTRNVGSIQRLIWGAGERVNSYSITNSAQLLFLPSHRDLTLANAFIQDTVSLGAVSVTAGLKLEDDPFWGWTPLPDLRATWGLSDRATLWAAASKAIRSPTPFDDDVVEKFAPNVIALLGNRAFHPERVTAFETGARVQANPKFWFSVSAFYNIYDDLRSIESVSPPQFFPIYWNNLLKGQTYGIGSWANWQATDWWRLSPGVVALHENLRFKAGTTGLLGAAEAADDPSAQATLTSTMRFSRRLTLDATLRYVGALPNPALAHYYELTARMGWRASDSLDLSVNGLNLLHAHHYEFAPSQGGEGIYRSVLAEARWRF